ncbi:MAG: cohesin domain-containing protein [Candidatus Aminicenantia bacterium]
MAPIGAQAATLYLMPQAQTIYQDDSFIVEVRLNTEGEEINTVGTGVIFPSDLLKALDFSQGNSVLTLWPERPEIKGNEVSFIGGTPQGFIGDGLILKITFKAISDKQQETRRAKVSFKENSKVLLNDGKGTKAELVFLEGNYEIGQKTGKLPRISSRTHRDQNKWYNQNAFHVHWDLIEGALYSYLLSYDPLAEPDEIPDKPEGELMWLGDMRYENLADGIYYFHLRESRETNAKQTPKWGPKVTFRAMIDTVSPEPFEPEIGQDKAVFGGKYFLSFATVDKMSGIDYYEILETRDKEQETWKIGESPYLLEDQSLQNVIKVKAVDKAGNERMAEIVPPEKPTPFPYWVVVIILVGIGVVWWLIKKLKRKYKK